MRLDYGSFRHRTLRVASAFLAVLGASFFSAEAARADESADWAYEELCTSVPEGQMMTITEVATSTTLWAGPTVNACAYYQANTADIGQGNCLVDTSPYGKQCHFEDSSCTLNGKAGKCKSYDVTTGPMLPGRVQFCNCNVPQPTSDFFSNPLLVLLATIGFSGLAVWFHRRG